MGRGRQKAKHTKVARDLKYFSPDTNLNALARELQTPTGDAEYVDKWGDEDDDEDDDSTDAGDQPQHRSA